MSQSTEQGGLPVGQEPLRPTVTDPGDFASPGDGGGLAGWDRNSGVLLRSGGGVPPLE